MATRDLGKLQASIWKTIDRIENKFQRELALNYKIALDDIRLQLAKIYEKYAKAGALTYAEMSKFNRLDKLQQELSDILGKTLARNGRLMEKLRSVQYQESFYRNAWALDQSSGVSLNWGLLNKKAVDAAINGPGWRELDRLAIKTWQGDGLVKLERTITQGLIQGMSYPDMAKAIKGNVADSSFSNAMRIVRTEGQRAAVKGQLDNYAEAESMGIEMQQIWDATLDKRTRPEHGELDGQAAVYSESRGEWGFDTAAGWVYGPLDPRGGPAFTINCRCRLRGQIEGYEPKVRRIRDEGVQPYITYKEWAKDKGIKLGR